MSVAYTTAENVMYLITLYTAFTGDTSNVCVVENNVYSCVSFEDAVKYTIIPEHIKAFINATYYYMNEYSAYNFNNATIMGHRETIIKLIEYTDITRDLISAFSNIAIMLGLAYFLYRFVALPARNLVLIPDDGLEAVLE